MSTKRRFGILTGGGDAPALNAAVRGVAKTLLTCLGPENCEVIGFEDGFEGVIEKKYQILTLSNLSGIISMGGTILGTSNRANPFAYFREGNADVSDRVVAYYRELQLECLFLCGGDGTMSMGYELSLKGINCIGVPKTIDNDIMNTERTFGFDTAVSIATKALNRLATTADAHHRVMILETMGRYAGWIALHCGMAAGVDLILVPEFEYDVDEVVRVIERRKAAGKKSTLIVMSEAARPIGGERAIRELDPNSPDPVRLGGISQVLCKQIQSKISSEIRATVLGHLQRGGAPTPFDRVLATSLGSWAARACLRGETNVMIALQNNRLSTTPLESVHHTVETAEQGIKRLTLRHPLVQTALSMGISFGFHCEYDPNMEVDDLNII